MRLKARRPGTGSCHRYGGRAVDRCGGPSRKLCIFDERCSGLLLRTGNRGNFLFGMLLIPLNH